MDASAVHAHARYFRAHLNALSRHHASLDAQRMTVLYFCVVGLDVLGEALPEYEREQTIEWIYNLQLPGDGAGFRGGTWAGAVFCGDGGSPAAHALDAAHAAMTYTALATLITLGDDLARVRKRDVSNGLRSLQRPDGSFTASSAGCENDVRFARPRVRGAANRPPLLQRRRPQSPATTVLFEGPFSRVLFEGPFSRVSFEGPFRRAPRDLHLWGLYSRRGPI